MQYRGDNAQEIEKEFFGIVNVELYAPWATPTQIVSVSRLHEWETERYFSFWSALGEASIARALLCREHAQNPARRSLFQVCGAEATLVVCFALLSLGLPPDALRYGLPAEQRMKR